MLENNTGLCVSTLKMIHPTLNLSEKPNQDQKPYICLRFHSFIAAFLTASATL
ncbi:MAG: hypothetical protein UZ08_BCD001000367 [Candidatus Parvibacillus calidus]|jgi:hypothetical protein|nr:MAG: hypothetical protein UZ08_BCD001000367 [Candidatus Parvibacillus calidus]